MNPLNIILSLLALMLLLALAGVNIENAYPASYVLEEGKVSDMFFSECIFDRNGKEICATLDPEYKKYPTFECYKLSKSLAPIWTDTPVYTNIKEIIEESIYCTKTTR